jgi:carboxymethylenebutenolidase
MPVHGEWIRFADQTGYFAYPAHAAKPLPSILVIQEVWGVEAQIIDTTRRLAAAGYAAYAPDLFAPHGTRPPALSDERIAQVQAFTATLAPTAWGDPAAREAALEKVPEPRRSEIRETFGQVFQVPGSLPNYVKPLRDALKHLKHERAETRGQAVGCVGFCMGGGLTALLACEEPELGAGAIFYGSSPASEKVASIACPLIGFYGANDQRVNAGVPAFDAAMKAAGKSFEHHIYEGANHAFFNEQSPRYDVKASRDSFVRLLSFFQKHLAT